MEKLFKKTLSLILVLCMVLGCCSTIFAGTKEPTKIINYVSLGDSMTNGYGLEGYDTEHYGYKCRGFGTYPDLLAKWLSGVDWDKKIDNRVDPGDIHSAYISDGTYKYKKGSTQVNLMPLAMSNMRAIDIAFFLNFDLGDFLEGGEETEDLAFIETLGWDRNENNWNNTYKQQWDEHFEYGDYSTWTHYVANEFINISESRREFEDKEQLSVLPEGHQDKFDKLYQCAYCIKAYQDAIKNADIVSLAFGNADVGVFLWQRLLGDLMAASGQSDAMFSPTEPFYDLEAVVERRVKDESLKPVIYQVYDMVVSKLEELGSGLIPGMTVPFDRVVNLAAYTVAEYCINYVACLKSIAETNTKDHLEVIVLDSMNAFSDLRVKYGEDQYFELGQVVSEALSLITAYTNVAPFVMQAKGGLQKVTFRFAKNDAKVFAINTKMTQAALEAAEESNPIVRERIIESVFDYVFKTSPLGGVASFRTVSSNLRSLYKKGQEAFADNPTADLYDYLTLAGSLAEQGLPNSDTIGLPFGAYLAIEEAVSINAVNPEIDLNSLLALVGGFDSLVGELMGALDMNAIKDDVLDGVFADLVQQLGNEELAAAFVGNSDNAVAVSTLSLYETVKQLRLRLLPMLVTSDNLPEDIEFDEAYVAEKAEFAGKMSGLLDLFARMIVGTGIGTHPSEEGHKILFDSVYKAMTTDKVDATSPIESYVAIGADTTLGYKLPEGAASYPMLVAGALKLETENVTVLGQKLLAWDTMVDFIKANEDTIKEADLITFNQEATGLLSAAGKELISGNGSKLDRYINPAIMEFVDTLLERVDGIVNAEVGLLAVSVNDYLEGLEPKVRDIVSDLLSANETVAKLLGGKAQLIEDYVVDICLHYAGEVVAAAQRELGKYASKAIGNVKEYGKRLIYVAFEYCAQSKEAVETLVEINPDARLIMVGMYNPFKGLELVINGSEIKLGDYFEVLISLTNELGRKIAEKSDANKFAFVNISKARTAEQDAKLDFSKGLSVILKLSAVINNMYSGQLGHIDIADSITAAICNNNPWIVTTEQPERGHIIQDLLVDQIPTVTELVDEKLAEVEEAKQAELEEKLDEQKQRDEARMLEKEQIEQDTKQEIQNDVNALKENLSPKNLFKTAINAVASISSKLFGRLFRK